MIKYKGYLGTIEYSEEDEIFFGEVIGVNALVSYEGTNIKELIQDFHNAVEDYMSICEEDDKTTYNGSFNVSLPPKLHREAAIFAANHGMSLNSFIESTVKTALE
ncbi:MAG: type II toxin-antitoxin system HicB family antitoxin [Ruminococcus sp.]|nr:type II toxin-antitoxin system HicB family antitoxin [Ruminococcus sp.]